VHQVRLGAARHLKLVLPAQLPQQLLGPTSDFSHLQSLSPHGRPAVPECFWGLPALRSLGAPELRVQSHENLGSCVASCLASRTWGSTTSGPS